MELFQVLRNRGYVQRARAESKLHLTHYIMEKCNIVDSESKIHIEKDVHRFCMVLSKRWKQSYATTNKFLKRHEKWLNGEVSVSYLNKKTQHMPSTSRGRPEKTFEESSDRTKFRRVVHLLEGTRTSIGPTVQSCDWAHVGDDQRDWDIYLPQFAFAINTTRHETTGFTPAFLNFGRQLVPPKSLWREKPSLPPTNLKPKPKI
ncbi:hypothetical protein QE152_g37109 [Popillia japonica]|uniref:Uncharacterized protein n=1 Tax=Popillia japonica TaxID=7064 RepID=A0AAW1IBJ3_POPJA